MARRRTYRRGKGEGSVLQRSDGTWRGAITTGYDGQGRQVKAYVYGKTQGEALAKLQNIKEQLAAGTYSKSDATVSEFLGMWLKEKGRVLRPSTVEQYARCVEKYIAPQVGGTRLDKLSPGRARDLINTIADEHGTAAANKSRVVLSNAYKLALRLQLVKTSPMSATDALPEDRREKTLWSLEQAARFLDFARGHRLYALFYLAMATGMRRGELLGLRWRDVTDKGIHVCHTLVKGELVSGPPKSRRGDRFLSITPDVVRVLVEHRQRQEVERNAAGEFWVPSELVFTSEVGTPLDPDNLKRVRYTLMDLAEVPRIGLHDLRHFYASLAIQQGTNPRELADHLGHSRPSVSLNVCSHQFDQQRTRAAISRESVLPRQTRGESN